MKYKVNDRLLNTRGEFLHPSCLPIDQVDFSRPRPVNMQFTFKRTTEPFGKRLKYHRRIHDLSKRQR